MPLAQGCQKMLQRLYNQRRIGGRHIPETICRKWIANLPKKERKKALDDWEGCIKEGLVLTKPKPSERHVFLNPSRIHEIKRYIKEGDDEKNA